MSDIILILIFLPFVLIQLGLQIYCLVDLYKRTSVRFDNKVIWVLIILLGSLLGAIIYLIFREGKPDGSHPDEPAL
ncbi:MAG: PLDc N-terminal domain-containing protein [Clostridia bacterium]